MAWYQIGTTNGVPQWRRDNPDGTYEVRVQENAPSVDAPVRGFDPESFYEEGRGERKAEIQARIKQAVEAKTKREVSPEERAEVLERQIASSRGLVRESLERQRESLLKRGVIPDVREKVETLSVVQSLIQAPPKERVIPTLRPVMETKEGMVNGITSFISRAFRGFDRTPSPKETIMRQPEGFSTKTIPFLSESCEALH